MTAWVLIPARNEGANIRGVLTGVAASLDQAGIPWRIVVIDDGSTDGTVAAVNAWGAGRPVTVQSQPWRGIGPTLADGLTRVAAQAADDDDVVVVMEGDGTSPPDRLPELVGGVSARNGIVIASRQIPGGGYRHFPLLRHWLSLAANRLAAVRFRLPGVSDYTFFYRAYRVGLLRAAGAAGVPLVTTRGFEANLELLIRLAPLAAAVAEIPCVYDYRDKRSRSNLRIVATIIGHLRLLHRGFRP